MTVYFFGVAIRVPRYLIFFSLHTHTPYYDCAELHGSFLNPPSFLQAPLSLQRLSHPSLMCSKLLFMFKDPVPMSPPA